MGASESSLSSSLRPEDQITTVSERTEAVDPIMERLKSLKLTTPILNALPRETSLTDLLVRKPLSSSQGNLNPNVIQELFAMYREWQEEKAHKISERQEEIENKIEVADALAVKLLQRFNSSVSAMKATSQHFLEVHSLQVDIGELKGRLIEVINNCDALCKRIDMEGPESLRSSIKPLALTVSDVKTTSNSSSGVSDVKQLLRDASACLFLPLFSPLIILTLQCLYGVRQLLTSVQFDDFPDRINNQLYKLKEAVNDRRVSRYP